MSNQIFSNKTTKYLSKGQNNQHLVGGFTPNAIPTGVKTPIVMTAVTSSNFGGDITFPDPVGGLTRIRVNEDMYLLVTATLALELNAAGTYREYVLSLFTTVGGEVIQARSVQAPHGAEDSENLSYIMSIKAGESFGFSLGQDSGVGLNLSTAVSFFSALRIS